MGRNRVPLEARFWSKVDRDSAGCWEWVAAKMPNGYGQIEGHLSGKKRPLYAHRVSWELTRGPIPDGAWVLHHCDNRGCVNPDHLYLGDHAANMADAVRRGRTASGERNSRWKRCNLTPIDVLAIRRQLEAGRLQREIAVEFDTTQQAVSKISLGQSWAWVE